MGLAPRIRAAGLRADCPMDVYIITAMNERPLLRLRYPSVAEAQAEIRATNDGSMPLEPYQLCSQYTLEPLLKSVAEAMPSLTLRWNCEFLGLTQDAAGVSATVAVSGGSETLRAAYLVGCDGGASAVRRELGIALRGEGPLAQFRQALFRCDELFNRLPLGNGPGRGRHYHVADDRAGFLIMQDSTRHWTLHASVETDEEMPRQFEKTIGAPVRYEMLSCGPWRQNLLLADRYQAARVFLAGDSAHLVIPTGGLGMNSGIGDAIDLGWKLAATLKGWGGPALLRSYEIERRQIGERNIGASRYASLGRRKWRAMWRPHLRDDSPEGKQARDLLTMVAEVEQRKSNEMIGAELGYRYVDSPVIWDIPGGPEHLFRDYLPTTWPGARLPHVWLDDGTPVQDRLPDAFTILRLGRRPPEMTALARALERFGAPVATLDLPDAVAREVYGADLLLTRPDLHVVWRGGAPPEDPAALAAVATGHRPS
jgi:2-polyprenyl-6-methoxyphenol hydroxylase-like FAD-dependent oxidoreductase